MTSAYLGSIKYYQRLLRSGAAFDFSVPFHREQGMNSCRIDSPNGALTLSIPVVNPHKTIPVGEILISEHGNWRHRHWNAFVSSYRQTPYFDYYEEDFLPFYQEHNWEKLSDFNTDLHNTVMRLLNVDSAAIQDISNIRKEPYYQLFAPRHGFIPDLSIVDLLFNMGPESIYWL